VGQQPLNEQRNNRKSIPARTDYKALLTEHCKTFLILSWFIKQCYPEPNKTKKNYTNLVWQLAQPSTTMLPLEGKLEYSRRCHALLEGPTVYTPAFLHINLGLDLN
jgi:RNase P subunit RPR2